VIERFWRYCLRVAYDVTRRLIWISAIFSSVRNTGPLSF
jgi:hypothetical protein